MTQHRWFRHLATVVALGAFATAGCFVVDDTGDNDNDDDEGNAGENSGGTSGAGGTIKRGGSGGGGPTGGTTSTGGSETGGSDTGGSSTGGSETGGSDTGGTGGDGGTGGAAGSGPAGGTTSTGGTGGSASGAVMKFCNGLARGEMDITLTLVLAGVRASAISGQCTPVVPNACIAIPTGAAPEVQLLEGTSVVLEGSFPTLTVASGDELLVMALFDDVAMMPGLYADTFEILYGPGYACADTDPVTDAPPTMLRSAPFDLPSRHNLRNVLLPSVHRETKGSFSAWRRP